MERKTKNILVPKSIFQYLDDNKICELRPVPKSTNLEIPRISNNVGSALYLCPKYCNKLLAFKKIIEAKF